MKLSLLGCIGRAVIKNAVTELIECLPFGRFLLRVARDVAEEFPRCQPETQARCAEVETLAQADAKTVRVVAEEAALEATRSGHAEARQPLAGYLAQLPGSIRRSLSRPDDMSGRTVPAGLTFNRAEDIVRLLPPRPPHFQAGARVNGSGDWVLLEWLGSGGCGEVWKAQSAANPKEIRALKFCLDPRAIRSLENEVKLVRRLMETTPGIGLVRLRGACFDSATPHVVYDYIPGGDLVRLIIDWHKSNKPDLIPETVRLVWKLATYLQPAHLLAGAIAHRDLKPSNILLQPNPKEKRRVYLRISDFGIGGTAAKQALLRSGTASPEENYTTSLRGAHSDLYASQQQIRGEPAHPRDDVYALGVLGYHVLNGDITTAPPADWEDVLAARGVPAPFITALGDCLADESEDRLENAGAVAARLAPLLSQDNPAKADGAP